MNNATKCINSAKMNGFQNQVMRKSTTPKRWIGKNAVYISIVWFSCASKTDAKILSKNISYLGLETNYKCSVYFWIANFSELNISSVSFDSAVSSFADWKGFFMETKLSIFRIKLKSFMISWVLEDCLLLSRLETMPH